MLAATAAGLLLSGCGGERANDEAALSAGSVDLALEQIIDNTVIPSAQAFQSQVSAFNSAASSFCTSPDATGLSNLQSSWNAMALAWYGLVPFNFGPLFDDTVFPQYQYIDSYRVRGTDYTATVRTNQAGLINGDTELSSSYFDARTFQYVGLLALEVASYEALADGVTDDNRTDAATVLAEYQASDRRCGILTGLAGSLQSRADYVVNGWTVDSQSSGTPYRDLFLAGETIDGAEPLTEMISAVQSYLDYLQQRNTVGNVAQIAGTSWAQMSASIASIEATLAGTENSTITLFGLMTAGGNSTDVDTVQANIDAARVAIASENTTDFNSLAAELDGNFKREIPDGLDVSLGINFSDGD